MVTATKKRKQRKPVPTDETNAQKFVRLANHRVRACLKTLKSIAKLSNRNGYEYTEKQVDQIMSTLSGEFQVTVDAFKAGQSTAADQFTLNV